MELYQRHEKSDLPRKMFSAIALPIFSLPRSCESYRRSNILCYHTSFGRYFKIHQIISLFLNLFFRLWAQCGYWYVLIILILSQYHGPPSRNVQPLLIFVLIYPCVSEVPFPSNIHVSFGQL